jgi:hypothetical protein
LRWLNRQLEQEHLLNVQPDVLPGDRPRRTRDADRVPVSAGHEPVEQAPHVLTRQYAFGGSAAPAGEPGERVLDGQGLVDDPGPFGKRVIHSGVERHRSHLLGVQLGVGGAQQRPVGQTEEGEPARGERAADLLVVTGDADRVHVSEQRSTPPQAAVAKLPVVGD